MAVQVFFLPQNNLSIIHVVRLAGSKAQKEPGLSSSNVTKRREIQGSSYSWVGVGGQGAKRFAIHESQKRQLDKVFSFEELLCKLI